MFVCVMCYLLKMSLVIQSFKLLTYFTGMYSTLTKPCGIFILAIMNRFRLSEPSRLEQISTMMWVLFLGLGCKYLHWQQLKKKYSLICVVYALVRISKDPIKVFVNPLLE